MSPPGIYAVEAALKIQEQRAELAEIWQILGARPGEGAIDAARRVVESQAKCVRIAIESEAVDWRSRCLAAESRCDALRDILQTELDSRGRAGLGSTLYSELSCVLVSALKHLLRRLNAQPQAERGAKS